MDRATKATAVMMIQNDSTTFSKNFFEIIKKMENSASETVDYFKNIVEQIPSTVSGPLIPKTPKVLRKKPMQRIETIPEDNNVVESSNAEETEDEASAPIRSKRAASQRATASIKVQQSTTLISKLRRPSENESIQPQTNQTIRTKRVMSSRSSTEDEESRSRPSKIIKMEEKKSDKRGRLTKIKTEPISQPPTPDKPKNKSESPEKTLVHPLRQSQRTSSKRSNSLKKTVVIDETMEVDDNDVTITEKSMYEDALPVGKVLPMNSTMLRPNSTMTIDRKMLNVTVVLEKMNDTVSLSQKNSIQSNNGSQRNSVREPERTFTILTSPKDINPMPTKNTLQNKLKALNQQYQEEALITDDESSPERLKIKSVTKKTQKNVNKKPKILRSSLISDDNDEDEDDDDDDDVAPVTPLKELSKLKEKKLKSKKEAQYKSTHLFSPYAKDSVKKKVEAFEQAVNSPANKPVAIDAPTRVTRTKTRAMKAAEQSEEMPTPMTIAQKLARKSLAKAKKISLSRQKREQDESKENTIMNSAQKQSTRLQLLNEKILTKQKERVTPIKKSRLQMPMSVSKLHQTPAKQTPMPMKALTASKAHNIGSSTESLTMTSLDKKKLLDDDATKRKEENLKLQSEEKRRRREEKEMKIKLAREAQERLEHEKRLKSEKEREEKARAALVVQEQIRVEAEKKRQIQLQRAQEKEERRKQEEQLKQQRLQEQEEVERQLAEQKRREQEAEKRRLLEARNKQLHIAEQAKLKQQYLAKAKAQKLEQLKQQQTNNPTNYILDSDPDDDESDDESKPKHPIPNWATSIERKPRLDMQQFVPIEVVLGFFGAKMCTPDLTELFVGIKKDRLKRTSSANWKTPPRYSMIGGK